MVSIRYHFIALVLAFTSQMNAVDSPRSLENLTTSENRDYEKAMIRGITPGGIKILHVSGAATISCPATLEDHQVIPAEHNSVAHADTYSMAPNSAFAREIWVYNNYRLDPLNVRGEN